MDWMDEIWNSFPFDGWEVVLIVVAGLWAGLINTIVGSGTLVTFPVLVTMGIAPVTATMSNAMGLIAGNITGAWGYRSKLRGVERTLYRLIPCSVLGGAVGAVLLMQLPEEIFSYVAPGLIVVALGFVIFQPRLQSFVQARKNASATPHSFVPETHTARDQQPLILYVLVFCAGVYGGYFVAAQGVLLLGILGVFLAGSLQTANAVKTVLVTVVNIIAALSYVIFAHDRINWWVVALIAVSSAVGSWAGAKVGQRLSPVALRCIIVALGVVALGNMIRQLL